MKKTFRHHIALILMMLCAGSQALLAQKLEKGFRQIANKEYVKAMEFFRAAKEKKAEEFAVNYALSRLFADAESPYFKADQALLCVINAQKHQNIENVPEDFIKRHYGFDYKDVEVQYHLSLFLVLNNVNKIETITQLFRMGINGDYERGILEEKAFKCALQENTTISYSRFLEFYKDSKYADQAMENYTKCWFEKADEYLTNPTKIQNGGYATFRALYPESKISKNCKTEEEYAKLRSRAIMNKDYQLDPEFYVIIENADSLHLNKDEILQYYITNVCHQGIQPKANAKGNTEFRVNNFTPREIDIAIGTKLFKTNKTTQRAKPKSTPSGKDFVMETYGDNPYAIKDFNRGRRAIAFYYTRYFDTDIDWGYFADTLEKIDFDDPKFKAAIARLQDDFPNAFYHDQSNSVGNNVFTRIAGAEIINNFGVNAPIFEEFENNKIPNSNMTFKSIEHYSSLRNPRTGRYTYYFVSTTPDSLVRGAYALVPKMDSTAFVGYKLVNLPPEGDKITIYRSNSPGLVFYERKWRDLYYLVEEKDGNTSKWVVKKKYKRE